MDFGLQGKTALVLGGGGGLGQAICLSLAAEGANVAVAGRGEASVQETCAELTARQAASLGLVWDIADLGVIAANLARVEAQFGPVDILVNNTGGPPPTTAAGQDPALWTSNFQSMVLSVIAITDHVLPAMRARKWGRIITSTSSGMVTPIPNLAISNALRLALAGWSKTLSQEVAADGITVNIVLPGRIATGRIGFLDAARAKRDGRDIADITAAATAAIPAGRYGTPEEYADVVTFLASTRAAYVTGSIIRVDGGMIPSV